MKKLPMLQSPFLLLPGLPCLVSLGFSISSDMMGVSSLRGAKWLCGDTSVFGGKSLPTGPCHGKLPFFCIFGPPPFPVCWWEFLAIGCGCSSV